MTKIKICGLRRSEDVSYVNRYLPDYIGFIFVKGRRRYISFDDAKALSASLDPRIKKVGVFVNEEIETIKKAADMGLIDIIQLHGKEDENYILETKESTGLQVIKAFSVETAEDIKKAGLSSADYILLDNGAGGTGRSFDWSLAALTARPYFLAGGLDINNVSEAVARFSPFALDISSGVETDGFKDEEKIKKIISEIRKTSSLLEERYE